MDDGLRIHGSERRGADFVDSVASGRFLFSMVMSYTSTCEVPGLTIAGADADSFKFTPPADAEYLHYGYCRTIKGIPVTPDGKPTPAVLTKAALEHASIPHVAINAGSRVSPRLPYVATGLGYGGNIRTRDAMSVQDVLHAVDYGRIVGRSLAPLADCLVIGESIPAGTTTAMAVLYGLGYRARVSSSMPSNPISLKRRVVRDAFLRLGREGAGRARQHVPGGKDGRAEGVPDGAAGNAAGTASGDGRRLPSRDRPNAAAHPERGGSASDAQATLDDVAPKPPGPGSSEAERQHYVYRITAAVGDPMIPFVAGMLSSASVSSKVMLAGGTQMAAVLAVASGIGYDGSNVAVGTTSYVAEDKNADFAGLLSDVSDVPAIAVDPGLDASRHAGLRAFAEGYAKEGVGAGGCIISAMLKTNAGRAEMARAIDAEYSKMFGSRAA